MAHQHCCSQESRFTSFLTPVQHASNQALQGNKGGGERDGGWKEGKNETTQEKDNSTTCSF